MSRVLSVKTVARPCAFSCRIVALDQALAMGVSELSVLAKKNNGVYPFSRVYELIDGTQQVKAHGTGAMPIWGADYVVKGAEYYVDVPFDAAIYVRSRILALTEYVYRLQAK